MTIIFVSRIEVLAGGDVGGGSAGISLRGVQCWLMGERGGKGNDGVLFSTVEIINTIVE